MFVAERSRHPQAPPEARPRLEARLQRAAELPLVLVVAAPGYGKTAALTRLIALDARPCIWYRCARLEPAGALARHLAESLAGPFVLEAGSGAEDGWSLVRDLSRATAQPRLLLIDDVQNLAAPDRDQFMALLTAGLPPGWCAAVSSTLEFEQRDVMRLLAEGEAAYLDEPDLALDRDEAYAVAAVLDLEDRHVETAWHRSSGWPSGLVALLQGREPWLAEYFSVRVLDQLTPRARRFLDASIVLEGLDADACRAVTRMADAADLLSELAINHAFLQRVGPYEGAFLPLFRSTVLDMLRRRRPSPLARWAARAAEYFLERGDPGTALRTATAVGDHPTAIGVFRRVAPGAVAGGRSDELRRWISLFPEEEQQNEPWLAHYHGVALRLAGDYANARQVQEQAQLAFRSANIRDGDAFAMAELGTLACLLRRPAEAEQLLEQARSLIGDADEVHHAAVLCALADAYVELNRLREATKVGEEAIALTAPDGGAPDASVHVNALQRVATVRIREGAFAQALEILQRVLEFARERHLEVETSTRTLFLLGLVRWATGDLDLADEILGSAAAVATRHDALGGLKVSIDAARVGVLTDLGRLDEADRMSGSGDAEPGFVLVDRRASLGWLRFLQGRTAEARVLFRQLLQESSLLGSVADVGRAKASLGVIALQLDRIDEAEQWLLDAARGFHESGARYRLAGAHLHLTDLYHRRNDLNQARRYLRLALDYATAADSYDFFLWHPATIARLAVFALRENIHAGYVEALCVRRLSPAEVPHFLPLLSRAQASLQAVARRIVDTLLSREAGISVAGLEQCANDAARLRLTRAIVEGCLTPRGLIVLRHQYRLTWAETDVFVAYYLTDLTAMAEHAAEPERRNLACRLAISENTLRHHITSIRQKLGLGVGRGSASVFLWALTTGIATWPPRNPSAAAT